MRIGIVSDTHGRTDRLRAALEALSARGAAAVVHCGDVGSAACLELLGASGLAAYAVAGNMDRHPEQLAEAARPAGVTFDRDVIELPLGDGWSLAATHGDDRSLLTELVAGGAHRYVCHGHTHSRRDETFGPCRLINPGALRSPKEPPRPSAALLDTDADTVEFLDVPK